MCFWNRICSHMLPVDDSVFLPLVKCCNWFWVCRKPKPEWEHGVKVFSFYHSKCTLLELTWMPHLQGWVWGLQTKTNTWYLSYKSYCCRFQKQQKSVKGLEGTDKLIDDFCHLTKYCFCAFWVASLTPLAVTLVADRLKCFCDVGLCRMSHSALFSHTLSVWAKQHFQAVCVRACACQFWIVMSSKGL